MLNRARSIVVVALSLAAAGLSCASSAPSPLNFSVQRSPRTSSEVLDSAELVLIGMGYAIARRDATENVIVTSPKDGAPPELSSRQTGGLRGPGARRTVAEVRAEPVSEGTRVFCKVSVQEQVTQAYRTFSAAQSGDDTPGSTTAIERDAGGTAAQNTVWQSIARDKSAERQILSAIAARIESGP